MKKIKPFTAWLLLTAIGAIGLSTLYAYKITQPPPVRGLKVDTIIIKVVEKSPFKKYDSIVNTGYNLSYTLYQDIENINSVFNIPDNILYRLIYKESSFRVTAKSPVGAYGLMQIMPDTWDFIEQKTYIDLDREGHLDNLYAGMWYLQYLHNKVEQNGKYSDSNKIWALTLASYNAGYGKASYALKYYPETINYVNYILQS